MSSRCYSPVSHLLVVPSKHLSCLLPISGRVRLRSSKECRLTLSCGGAWYGTTFRLPLDATPKCSSSAASADCSSCSTSTPMKENLTSSRELELRDEDAVPSDTQPAARIHFPRLKLAAGCLLAFAVSYGFHMEAALAVAENSIAASGLGIKVATFLRGSGWPDELIVLTVAMLPVLELRGAIPISYWLKLDPIKGYALAVLGNMVPVPFVVLYLEKLSRFLGDRSSSAKTFLTWLFEKTRKKGGVIEEFEWLGLMLFVAVPFPGTGAWTGAFLAALLGMPFWEALTANLCGVLLAGLLVNLVVTLGAKYALAVGAGMFIISTFMWNVLRLVKRKEKKDSA
ncbi:hypothetical protein R1sor_017770 [Riccia sorocarpa]|uniref:Small multi-drug export protein n=1 Tax=Riccia sorocarpa TaxID=122646 RepID=A0ABD3I7S7_9MARC